MINRELIVDNFAGGGGASTGIEMATGISVDIAINHDPEAIRMHKTNHPNTKHYCESVWECSVSAATGSTGKSELAGTMCSRANTKHEDSRRADRTVAVCIGEKNMDRHLCKAKKTDNGKWMEGYYLKDGVTGKSYIYATGNCLNESEKVGEEGCLKLVAFEIDPSTICRCTGLWDGNGKLIWEHDIIAFTDMYSTESGYAEMDCMGKVLWDDETLSFQVTERLSAESWEVLADCIVFGNIFDNQEVLEVEEAMNVLEKYTDDTLSPAVVEAHRMAITALEEIQQYRAIGTVEEFREAVEKQQAKKPLKGGNTDKLQGDIYICAKCSKVVRIDDCGCFYCPDCGQHIDWSE